ncbi:MAG: hypothetical protein Q8936_21510 [Bacillota bacterium]|nr:hypothetical protein [Bacillota bacterium]
MEITDFLAVQKWAELPKNVRQRFINNVHCSKCGVTTIVSYSLHRDKNGIFLIGKCKKCGSDISRFIEDE